MTRPNAEPAPQRGVIAAPAVTAAEAPAEKAEAAPVAQAEAELDASAQTIRVAGLVASAPTPPPPGPPGGTVYGAGDRARDSAPTGRQPGLRVGWHTASLPAVAAMGVASAGSGLLLGADHDQQPVPVRFFRAEPTRVTLVGGVWAAQMLAFRALALGAHLVVTTVDPAAWNGFGERAVGRADRVVVLAGEQPQPVAGTARQPTLVIHDLGTAGPVVAPPSGPWQTHLTVLRRLDAAGAPAVRSCDLVVLQRLDPAEASVAESALQLDPQSAQRLQMLENEMLALIGGGANRYLWLHPTPVELQHMGSPWR